jgi:hypothetical protein
VNRGAGELQNPLNGVVLSGLWAGGGWFAVVMRGRLVAGIGGGVGVLLSLLAHWPRVVEFSRRGWFCRTQWPH